MRLDEYDGITRELAKQYQTEVCDGREVAFFVCDRDTFIKYHAWLLKLFKNVEWKESDFVPDHIDLCFPAAEPITLYQTMCKHHFVKAVCRDELVS